jgi:hypothetical protein
MISTDNYNTGLFLVLLAALFHGSWAMIYKSAYKKCNPNPVVYQFYLALGIFITIIIIQVYILYSHDLDHIQLCHYSFCGGILGTLSCYFRFSHLYLSLFFLLINIFHSLLAVKRIGGTLTTGFRCGSSIITATIFSLCIFKEYPNNLICFIFGLFFIIVGIFMIALTENFDTFINKKQQFNNINIEISVQHNELSSSDENKYSSNESEYNACNSSEEYYDMMTNNNDFDIESNSKDIDVSIMNNFNLLNKNNKIYVEEKQDDMYSSSNNNNNKNNNNSTSNEPICSNNQECLELLKSNISNIDEMYINEKNLTEFSKIIKSISQEFNNNLPLKIKSDESYVNDTKLDPFSSIVKSISKEVNIAKSLTISNDEYYVNENELNSFSRIIRTLTIDQHSENSKIGIIFCQFSISIYTLFIIIIIYTIIRYIFSNCKWCY